MCSKETHSLRVFTVILLAAASLSSVSTRGLKVILLTSGAFLFMAGVGVSITLLVVAPTLQPTSWAVRQYDANDMGETGLPNLPYMFLIGCLMGQATFIGGHLLLCLSVSALYLERHPVRARQSKTPAPGAHVLCVRDACLLSMNAAIATSEKRSDPCP